MKRFSFDIDVVGACNLRCPSCPQGNVKDYRLPHGYMDRELLARIVRKAVSECAVARISLFSWGEPLLHPGIHELVRTVQEAGIPCHLSSNLNILPDADSIMAANPASFKISVSGFTQETYGFSHRGGDMKKVKGHMVLLAEAKQRTNASTRIFVNYHRYRHNLKEEPMMRKFAEDLGFEFEPAWALLFPVEKILCLENVDFGAPAFSDEDRNLIGQLALPFREALEASRVPEDPACPLREEQISMDFQGNVQLCCGIFDAGRFTVGNYLELPLDDIQKMRHNHGLCERCMKQGAHLYLTYRTPGMESLILGNIPPEDAELLKIKDEFVQERRRRRIQRIYQAFFSKIISKERKDRLKTGLAKMLRPANRARRSPDGRG